jgi:hypothetical protein
MASQSAAVAMRFQGQVRQLRKQLEAKQHLGGLSSVEMPPFHSSSPSFYGSMLDNNMPSLKTKLKCAI